jgi:hypothetical protein
MEAEEVVVLPFTLEPARVSAPIFVATPRGDLLAEALRDLGLEVITPEFIRAEDGRKLSSSTMRPAIAQSQAARFAEA